MTYTLPRPAAPGSMKFLSYKSKRLPYVTVGLVDADEKKVTPLLFPNRRPVETLQRLIEVWDEVAEELIPGYPEEAIEDVEILAPFRGRDILCVGKNYKAHAVEFATSGYDSSDKKEQPDFPVIFTKRATSIISTGTPIYPHPNVTSTLDYEGELGIIVGKGGIGIKKENGWDHVWGACIINDFTARERQRDHKQFYIGKSLDTFCPMGPFAVPASHLDWNNMILETKLNGEVRQHQNTNELIFDIPTLIETCSMGITLQPGDVIATGTPAGVCLSAGKFLKPGDQIDISITGLGTLSNVVGSPDGPAPKCEPVSPAVLPATAPDVNLVKLPSGSLHVWVGGVTSSSAPTAIFVHGLGGWHTNYLPIIAASGIDKTHRVVAFDLEGMGQSPASGNAVTIDTCGESVKEVLDHVGAAKAVVVGHSMGGLICTTFAAAYPERVEKLLLIGPVKAFPEAGQKALAGRAATVRDGGMSSIAAAVTTAGTSAYTQASRPLATGAVMASLLAQPAEGYAQACLALGAGQNPDYSKVTAPVLIAAGDEDKTSPKATTDFLADALKAEVKTLKNVGHWHLLEDVEGTAELLKAFVK